MRRIEIFYFFLIVSLTIFFPPLNSEAGLTLSVNPVEGGNSLRFGRVSSSWEVNKEVKIRATASDGKKYQVFQRLIEPFVNEANSPLAADAVKTYALIGSNSSGTLYLQNIENLSLAEQLLYTSSDNGESDSFTVVYSTTGDRVNAPGILAARLFIRYDPLGPTRRIPPS